MIRDLWTTCLVYLFIFRDCYRATFKNRDVGAKNLRRAITLAARIKNTKYRFPCRRDIILYVLEYADAHTESRLRIIYEFVESFEDPVERGAWQIRIGLQSGIDPK